MSQLTPENIREWKTLRDSGMTSAVGEYTPSAFWELLDAYETHTIEIARLREELNGWIDSSPLITDRTRNETRALLGPVYRHKTDDGGEIGVIEVTRAIDVVQSLVAAVAVLGKQNAELLAQKGQAG